MDAQEQQNRIHQEIATAKNVEKDAASHLDQQNRINNQEIEGENFQKNVATNKNKQKIIHNYYDFTFDESKMEETFNQ
jgi:hypothetical protein